MRAFASICACLLVSLPLAASLLPTDKVVLCGTSCQTLVSQSTAVNYSNTLQNGASSITVSALVDADPSAMTLRAYASYSNLVGTYYSQMNAEPSFQDTVTISAPGLNGTLGYLQMPFSVNGTTTQVGLGQVAVSLTDPAGTGTFQSSTCYFTNSGVASSNQPGCSFSGNGLVVPASLSFHYGTPFTLGWFFGAEVYPGGAWTSGYADYYHTANVDGLEIFNSAGVNLTGPNVMVQTAGGESFAVVAATPEPAPAVMFSLAAILALLLPRGGWSLSDASKRKRESIEKTI